MIMETTLNDRWSRAAQAMTEPEPKRVAASRESAGTASKTAVSQPQLPEHTPAWKIAGLTPEIIARHLVKNVAPDDKRGDPATALGGTVSLWIQVTPEMAARWMKSNFRNRPVSDDTVAAYARDMAANRWQATHQGIAFNDQDQLIDGQHRLLAVIKCQKTVRMMVTFGLASKIEGSEMTTMDCVDRGRTRTVADQLKIQHGLKEGSQIAQIASVLAHLCVGERVRRLSVGHTLDIYRAFQPAVEFVIEHRSKAPGLKSAGVLGAFAFWISGNGGALPARDRFVEFNVDCNLFGALKLLRAQLVNPPAHLTSEQHDSELKRLRKGIAELVIWALAVDAKGEECRALEASPAEWGERVEHLRKVQPARVRKVAALFEV